MAMLFTAAGAVFLMGCASTRDNSAAEEDNVSLSQLSAPARATLVQEISNGRIRSIEKETENGRPAYEVEAVVDGRAVEITIAESDGSVLERETEISIAELPASVRAAVEEHFGASDGLLVMKCIENGETFYEVEGHQNGRAGEVTFNSQGIQTDGEEETDDDD
jgi:uncharacterized membrane protein YkoI